MPSPRSQSQSRVAESPSLGSVSIAVVSEAHSRTRERESERERERERTWQIHETPDLGTWQIWLKRVDVWARIGIICALSAMPGAIAIDLWSRIALAIWWGLWGIDLVVQSGSSSLVDEMDAAWAMQNHADCYSGDEG